ncbi:GNAT family N-acetyltransferase [Nocardioides sp. URHA0020]|uniref:GNAT family N-acetyltransferase n=1 Tax=Nocardioides sp. URHA0020 TaxID=1380392 RepID=UPI00048EE5F1|nr:GNAT family N-acetyltransferase [Nocardioides sp. URHA0020]
MEVLSRGWQTDLAILTLSGSRVEQHPTYVVVRTPDNPTYRWGNFLLLRRTPLRRDLDLVEDLFSRELPGIAHRTYGFDDPDGSRADLHAFADAGFDVEASVVLTATAVHPPPRPNASAELRPLAGDDDDWAQRVSLDLACHDGGADGFADFTRRKAAAERRLTERGDGTWYGAFDSGRLVATMGVVRAGNRVARFQEVQTHPEARGRGVAGSLVHAAGSDALRRLGATTLVTVADPDHHAIRIYRSVGFVDSEVQLMAERARV